MPKIATAAATMSTTSSSTSRGPREACFPCPAPLPAFPGPAVLSRFVSDIFDSPAFITVPLCAVRALIRLTVSSTRCSCLDLVYILWITLHNRRIVAVHQGKEDRHEGQCAEGRQQQASDDRATQWSILLATIAQSQRHRHHTD